VDAGFLDVLHHPGDEHVLAIGEGVDVHLDGVREVAVEQQRALAEHHVDLAGLVVGVLRLDVGRHQGRQRAGEVGVEARSSRMISMARPPST
jgi:hypothetical protein